MGRQIFETSTEVTLYQVNIDSHKIKKPLIIGSTERTPAKIGSHKYGQPLIKASTMGTIFQDYYLRHQNN